MWQSLFMTVNYLNSGRKKKTKLNKIDEKYDLIE